MGELCSCPTEAGPQGVRARLPGPSLTPVLPSWPQVSDISDADPQALLQAMKVGRGLAVCVLVAGAGLGWAADIPAPLSFSLS